jgi:DNA-binding CsgD family transcriptional regulator
VGETSVQRRVADLLPELYALRPIEQFPAHALGLVRCAVGGNKGDYTEVDLRTGNFHVLVDPEPPELSTLDSARRAHMHTHPVLAHFRRTAAPGARSISDFLTTREFHRLGLYGEFFAQLNVEDQLTVLVSPASATVRAGISVDRDRPRFDARDRLLLDTLQPHLRAARDNAIRFSAALSDHSSRTTPGSPIPAVEHLTDRQTEVLVQISQGLTDAQIAFRLQISVGTVRKHVEHILRRLQTPTRTAAAVRYLTSTEQMSNPNWTASIASFLKVTG